MRQGDLSQGAVCPLSTFSNSGQSTQPSFLQPLLPCGWWRRGLLSSFPRHGPFSDLSDFQSQAGLNPQPSCLHTRVLRLQACTSIWPGIPAPHLSDTSITSTPIMPLNWMGPQGNSNHKAPAPPSGGSQGSLKGHNYHRGSRPLSSGVQTLKGHRSLDVPSAGQRVTKSREKENKREMKVP